MTKTVILLGLALSLPSFGQISGGGVTTYNSAPSTCIPNAPPNNFIMVGNSSSASPYYCSGVNTFALVGTSSASGTVTGVACTTPGASWLTCTVTNPNTSVGVSFSAATGQTSHLVLGTGSGSSVSLISLTTADLPTLPLTQLANIAANTIVGNNGSGSASPSASAIPTCNVAGSSALTWTPLVGFGCTAISGTGSGIGGSGTPGSIPVWSTSSSIVNSGLSESAGILTITDNTTVIGTSGAGQITTSAGTLSAPSSGLFTFGINTNTGKLDCINSSSADCMPGTTNQNIRSVVADFGDFTSTASALTTAAQSCVVVPFSGTITKAQLIATPSGSATVDVRTVAFGSYTGPSSSSTITASDTPALSSAVSYSDSTLTGWTTSVTANTVFCFYLTSPTTITGIQARLSIAAN